MRINVLLEDGPTGIRWIINDREPVIRRVVWFFFTTFGIYYTWAVVYKNVNIYSKYTSSMVTVYRQGVDGRSVEFPRVTTCLNSMHSRMVLNHIHEDLMTIIRPLYLRGSAIDDKVNWELIKSSEAWKKERENTFLDLEKSRILFENGLDNPFERPNIVAHTSRFQVNNQIGVPVNRIQQAHKKFLGHPYSRCTEKVLNSTKEWPYT
ncbi:Oidioi.mRNA.OKI2018_I69.XSR.g14656.t1.cds [Oikopleura dioica]|uniref:Oidioi.mRNA.OKI2018_I69.XSR.g14656.t1.cds n=1 Tax=Oikopleura dioica TaxID=34765 RepID=A0ABN7SFF8_OIKDI|nr:Oidioi.mRNA.OKI2018_I69.XSR.g14656.t1.cds [Oikopleura dioica]